MRMAQQANPALTIPASPLGQGLIFRRECQGKPLCKHGTWVIPKRQSWRNLSCYQPRLTAKRPMRAASDCQFGQNQPGNRQPVTIVPKPNKACSGIPKLNPAVWIMERSSTLGRSVQADPAWGQEPYLRWRRPPAVGRPAQFHLECPGATEDSSAERADNSRHLREKYFCYG